jgi:hypothetical protein
MAGQHGTRTRYNSGCRCDECKQSSRDYDKRRRLAKAADVKPSQVVTRLPVGPGPDESAIGSAGRVEAGVLAEIGSLSNSDSRLGLVEIAIALARVLDSPLAIAQHPSAAHRLSETLDKIRKGADGRTGRLAAVRQMTRNSKATG